jgi:hypothetical protein
LNSACKKKTALQWLEFSHQPEGLGFHTFPKLSFSSTDKRDGKEKEKSTQATSWS